MVCLSHLHQALATLGRLGGTLVAQNTGGAIDDVSATRRIQIIVAALAVAGVALGALTVWLWRSTKPHLDVLGPLEVMGKRRFWRSDPNGRQRALDAARPEGATAIPEIKPPPVDLAALAASRSLPSMDDHGGFGDLVEASVPGEHAGAGMTHAPTPRVDGTAPPSTHPPSTLPAASSAGALFDQADFTDMYPRPPADAIPSLDADPVEVVELPSNLRELPFRPFARSFGEAVPPQGGPAADALVRRPFPPPIPQDLVDAEMEPIDIPDPD